MIILNYDFYLKELQVVVCHFHVSGCHKLEKTKTGACMIQFIKIDSDLRSVKILIVLFHLCCYWQLHAR